MLAKFVLVCLALLPAIAAQTRSSVANCSEDAVPCGSAFFSTCCPSQWKCNYRRGIPICQDPSTRVINGFSDEVCSIGNPYLLSCDIIGIPGFCCPIGMTCHHLNQEKGKVYCINPYGVTTSAYPTSTSVTAIPSVTVVPAPAETEASSPISFIPNTVWSTISLEDSDLKSTCGGSLNPHRRVTNVLNATISFNYTGPAIMIRTIPSKTGGVFSLIIDGFNTTSYIDTYTPSASTPDEARGENLNSSCYRVHQFPPMNIVPPGYESREAHTVSLVYIGAGPSLLGADLRNLSVQFDSFALPIYSEAQMTSASMIPRVGHTILVSSFLILTASSLFLL